MSEDERIGEDRTGCLGTLGDSGRSADGLPTGGPDSAEADLASALSSDGKVRRSTGCRNTVAGMKVRGGVGVGAMGGCRVRACVGTRGFSGGAILGETGCLCSGGTGSSPGTAALCTAEVFCGRGCGRGTGAPDGSAVAGRLPTIVSGEKVIAPDGGTVAGRLPTI
jgi:hypothetical protein